MSSQKKNKYKIGPIAFDSKESAEACRDQLLEGNVFKIVEMWFEKDQNKETWFVEGWDKKPI